MDGLVTLSRHRQVARIVMLSLMAVVVVLRWLVASPLGLLALAALVYRFARVLFDVSPMRPFEVLAWGAGQDPQVILAAAGIFGAYWIATRTWKDQKRLELQLEAATTILAFFESARTDAMKLEFFADRLNALHANLLAKTTEAFAPWQSLAILQQLPEMAAIRMRLSEQASQVHILRSRYELILTQGIFTSFTFDHAQKALDGIASSMWFPIPFTASNVAELTQQVAHADARQWAHFVRVSSDARTQMSAATGGLVGLIHGKLFGPTLAGLMRVRRTSREFMADQKADA